MTANANRPKTARAERAEELAAALRTGVADADKAYRELFDLYYEPLRHFFARRGFAPDRCLDLTQEVFLGIYTGIGSFRREAGFETWLFTIATNAFRKELRRQGAEKRSGEEVPIEADDHEGHPRHPPAKEPSPNGVVLDQERSEMLRRAIEKLPDQMRQCLLLRIDQDLKYREIGVLMGLSTETVKSHLFQARRHLKRELEPYFQPDLSALAEET